MGRITSHRFRFEAPTEFDPADFSMHTKRVADQVDDVFADYDTWLGYLAGVASGEIGSPAVIKARSSNQTGFPGGNLQKQIDWNSTPFNNTGTAIAGAAGELYLPDQEQRYWWYMGTNLYLPTIQLTGRYIARIIVTDFDPATGQAVTTTAGRFNHYMQTSGAQYMLCEGVYRSGGGRVRVTLGHNNTGGIPAVIDVNAGSSVWAIRLGPAK